MKPISIACAVAVVIACMCVLQAARVPLSESQVHQEEPAEETEDVQSRDASSPANETSPEVLFRTKRQSHLSLCRYCCNCCKNKGCGYCCRY